MAKPKITSINYKTVLAGIAKAVTLAVESMIFFLCKKTTFIVFWGP